MFLYQDNKIKLVPVALSYFLETYERKKINLKSMVVIKTSHYLSLYYKETN